MKWLEEEMKDTVPRGDGLSTTSSTTTWQILPPVSAVRTQASLHFLLQTANCVDLSPFLCVIMFSVFVHYITLILF